MTLAGLAGPLLALCLRAAALAEAGAPGAVFDFGAGARPLALGGAYSAVARDALALYYNPAGLSRLGGRNVSLMHATLFEGMSYDYLGYAQNYARLPGGWGAHVIRFSAGTADGRDENNQPVGGFSYGETALAAGTGLHGLFLPSLSAGAAFKVLDRSMDGESTRLLGFDLGAQYGPLLGDRLRLGLALRNVGGFATGDTSDKLPMTLKVGAAYEAARGLLLAADLEGGLRLGAEYELGPGAVRLGYDRDAFTFGAGIRFLKAYQLDYAMFKHEELGLSNRISLSYSFGGVKAPPKVERLAPDFIKKAEDSAAARDYAAALESAGMAIGMDPEVKKGPWGEKYRRLEALNVVLRLKELPARKEAFMAPTPQGSESGRSAAEYLEGNNEKAVLLAHSAAGYAPGDALFGEFLSGMANLAHGEVKRDEILPRAALLKEKLRKAEAFFQSGAYDKAARECEQVLLLDEKSALAWTRLGSAAFALGDMQRSRKAFAKALELDPENVSVSEFMLMQGWR